jgi:hypothetical protein
MDSCSSNTPRTSPGALSATILNIGVTFLTGANAGALPRLLNEESPGLEQAADP